MADCCHGLRHSRSNCSIEGSIAKAGCSSRSPFSLFAQSSGTCDSTGDVLSARNNSDDSTWSGSSLARHIHLSSRHSSSQGLGCKSHGCAKKGGRPVTWIGGGGMDPRKLAGLGVPALRALFTQVFGEQTASNNAGWLRRKLAESPDTIHGQRRSPVVRARDMGAAIWNAMGTNEGGFEEEGIDNAEAMEEEQDSKGLATIGHDSIPNTFTGATQPNKETGLCGRPRSVKRSVPSAESAVALGYCGSVKQAASPSGSGSGSPTATQTGMSLIPVAWSDDASPATKRHCNVSEEDYMQCDVGSGNCQPSGLRVQAGVLKHLFETDIGREVMVYWPADNKWWLATICKIRPPARELRLLYADMTEESVDGRDYDDLLNKGHLMMASGTGAPADVMVTAASVPPTALSAGQCAVTGCNGSNSRHCDSQGTGGGSAETPFSSGSACMPEAAVHGHVVAGQCHEVSVNTTGSGVAACCAMPAVASNGDVCMQQGEQQQTGQVDVSHLSASFASQQRHQQLLQLQQQGNAQLVEQSQMQMHDQMAAHLIMQQAATAACGAGARGMSAPAVLAACTGTVSVLYSSNRMACSPGSLAGDIQQLQQLQHGLRQAMSQPIGTAGSWPGLPLTLPVSGTLNTTPEPVAGICTSAQYSLNTAENEGISPISCPAPVSLALAAPALAEAFEYDVKPMVPVMSPREAADATASLAGPANYTQQYRGAASNAVGVPEGLTDDMLGGLGSMAADAGWATPADAVNNSADDTANVSSTCDLQLAVLCDEAGNMQQQEFAVQYRTATAAEEVAMEGGLSAFAAGSDEIDAADDLSSLLQPEVFELASMNDMDSGLCIAGVLKVDTDLDVSLDDALGLASADSRTSSMCGVGFSNGDAGVSAGVVQAGCLPPTCVDSAHAALTAGHVNGIAAGCGKVGTEAEFGWAQGVDGSFENMFDFT